MVSTSRLLVVAGVTSQSLCQAWPGMRKKTNTDGEEYIGPDCTVGVGLMSAVQCSAVQCSAVWE